MIHLKIQGEIVHFFEVKHQYSRIHESISFPKQNILIESEGQQYTISFVEEKIDLLKFCKLGSIVEINVSLKGRMWNFNDKQYSVNELLGNSLKIIRNTILNDFVRYKGCIYNLEKKYEDNQLIFNLVNIENDSKYILSVNHVFPDKSINKDHVMIMDTVDIELLNCLENMGILTIDTYIKSINGVSGIICKILVLDLFTNGELLFTKLQEKEVLGKENINDEEIQISEEVIKSILGSYGTNRSSYEDDERDYFNTMTDGQMGNYDDFNNYGGEIDDIDTWSRG